MEIMKKQHVKWTLCGLCLMVVLSATWIGWLLSQRQTFPPAERPNRLEFEQALIRLAAEIEEEGSTHPENDAVELNHGESNKTFQASVARAPQPER
jgi:hypothetical protein